MVSAKKTCFGLISLPAFILAVLGQASAQADDLAKASQNPIGDMVSLPVEVWHHSGMPNGSDANLFLLKPVFPISVGDLNLINRLIVPYVDLNGPEKDVDFGPVEVPEDAGRDGWGNIQYQAFFTPAQPSKVILGLGPVFEFPTHTEGLGSDKWSAGLGAVALSMPGNWVLGALVQNLWSYAGDDDAESVNKMMFQYFINYNFDKGWYLTSTPVITANGEKDSDNRWTVPVGGGFGRLVKFGKQPVDFKLQAFWNVESPERGADWSTMFAVKFLFPK